jgi:acyl-CoA reductase-like NAD-dependent aldehyde dehydrogenase
MGQICIAVNRILVDRQIHGRFVDALATLTEAIELGPGGEAGVAYGPVFKPAVIQRTCAHLHDALAKGGRLVAGGYAPTDPALATGYFFRPTLVDNAPLDCLPMKEETFGPLTAIRAFESQPEMLALANGLPYGLAAYLYSRDLESAWALADRLEFGMVGVNVNDTSELQAPFGGWKLSGLGRELGRDGLHAYLQTKSIRMRVRRA